MGTKLRDEKQPTTTEAAKQQTQKKTSKQTKKNTVTKHLINTAKQIAMDETDENKTGPSRSFLRTVIPFSFSSLSFPTFNSSASSDILLCMKRNGYFMI